MNLDPWSRAWGGIICPGCICSNQSRFQGFSLEGGRGWERGWVQISGDYSENIGNRITAPVHFFKAFLGPSFFFFFLPPFSASCFYRHPADLQLWTEKDLPAGRTEPTDTDDRRVGKDVSADKQAVDAQQKQLTTMIPECAKREQAEKRIRSVTSRCQRRAKTPKPARAKQSHAAEMSNLKAKISELSLVMAFFKTRK